MEFHTLNDLTFIWDENKDKSNYRKHYIHFTDTISIFDDYYRLEELDKENSIDEVRFITIGRVDDHLIHLSYKMRGDKIRIISARKATKAERKSYPMEVANMDELFSNNTSSIVSSNRILYTASSFARNSLLHLQEIGELEAKRSHTSFRSGLSSYLFFTVVSSSGTLVYNDKHHRLSSGECVFIDCNLPYSHTTDEHNLWTLCWIHFYGPTMGNIYDKYKERGGRPVFTPDDSAPFLLPGRK